MSTERMEICTETFEPDEDRKVRDARLLRLERILLDEDTLDRVDDVWEAA